MKMICAPSQVMREGSDLNQHGQAGRQEQASSSSPVIFHAVFPVAAAALPRMPNAAMPHTIATETTDLLDMIAFISFFPLIKTLLFFEPNVIPRRKRSILKAREVKVQNGR